MSGPLFFHKKREKLRKYGMRRRIERRIMRKSKEGRDEDQSRYRR